MDELEALGLDARHRRALERSGITSWLELVLEERAVVLKAMTRTKLPRPTLEDIAGWQDEARMQLKRARRLADRQGRVRPRMGAGCVVRCQLRAT